MSVRADTEAIARGAGLTEEQARLYAVCCAAADHYQALKAQHADRYLIARAKQAWDDAATAYTQSERHRA